MPSHPRLRATLAAIGAIGAVLLTAARPAPKTPALKLSPDSLRALSTRYTDLESDLRLLKARLALANGDSMYLVLDGTAKTLTLELGGVPLRKCSLITLRLDRRLES